MFEKLQKSITDPVKSVVFIEMTGRDKTDFLLRGKIVFFL